MNFLCNTLQNIKAMSDDIAVGLMIFVIGLAFVEWIHPGTTLAIYHMIVGDSYYVNNARS